MADAAGRHHDRVADLLVPFWREVYQSVAQRCAEFAR
jgi:hypothetical protein